MFIKVDGAKRVSFYLREKNIEANVVTLDESTRTSQLAADALGCTVAEIAKSIAFKAGGVLWSLSSAATGE